MFLAENESHIYPNMCAKFGCGPTVVSKGGVVQIYTQTNIQTDSHSTGVGIGMILHLSELTRGIKFQTRK